jgi:general secretion pathway protein D
MRTIKFLCIAALLFAGAAITPAQTPDNNKDRDKVTLNFVGADIASVVKAIGLISGKNFILDPRVTGTVNIVSASPVHKDLVYPILLSALRLQGFTAVEGPGNTVKIVPEADAKLNYSQTTVGGVNASGDKIVTQIYPLKYESAAQLLPVLRPLIAPNNVINAYPNNNTLVITDYAENLKRIDKIIASIDTPQSSQIEVIRLKNASAFDMSQLLPRLMPEAAAPIAIPGAQPRLAFAVDSRTNGLIVRADGPATIEKVKRLVESLDVQTSETGNIHVIYLRNAEATKVAETLRGILGGPGGGGGATPGAPPPPPQPILNQPGQQNVGGAGAAASTPAPIVNIPQQQGGGVIQAYAATNSLVIIAPDYVYNSIRSVVDKLDARRAQVFVEAIIVELAATKAAEFGVQWLDAAGINSPNLRGIGGFQTDIGGNRIGGVASNVGGFINSNGSGPNGLNVGIIRGTFTLPGTTTQILNLGVLAKALEQDGTSNILSTPNLLTLDNEEAKIIDGRNVPFITGSQTNTTGGLANPFQTVERKDIGLQLKVKPTIAEGGSVKLQIFQEVSDVDPSVNTQGAGLATTKRSVETTVIVDDGQIVVLGGLIKDTTTNNVDKVPVLGNIPVLGNLFKYEKRGRTKTNLMVFIRPAVLRNTEAGIGLTNERYDYIRNEQAIMAPGQHLILPDVPNPQLPAIQPAPRESVPTPPIPPSSSALPPAAKQAPAPRPALPPQQQPPAQEEDQRWQPIIVPESKTRPIQ